MYHSNHKQNGNILVLSIFIIVIVGLFSFNLTIVKSNNSKSLTKDVMGAQAWFVAHSGVEWALVNILNKKNELNICNGIPHKAIGVKFIGISCHNEPEVICTTNKINFEGENITIFKIRSTVSCGPDDNVTRVQEVAVKIK